MSRRRIGSSTAEARSWANSHLPEGDRLLDGQRREDPQALGGRQRHPSHRAQADQSSLVALDAEAAPWVAERRDHSPVGDRRAARDGAPDEAVEQVVGLLVPTEELEGERAVQPPLLGVLGSGVRLGDVRRVEQGDRLGGGTATPGFHAGPAMGGGHLTGCEQAASPDDVTQAGEDEAVVHEQLGERGVAVRRRVEGPDACGVEGRAGRGGHRVADRVGDEVVAELRVLGVADHVDETRVDGGSEVVHQGERSDADGVSQSGEADRAEHGEGLDGHPRRRR